MRKKILFVNGHLNIGGVEKSLLDVLKSFNYSAYEVDLVLLDGLGDYIDEVPKEVNIIHYDLTKTFGPIGKFIIESVKKREWFGLCFRIIFSLQKILGIRALSLAKPLFKLNKHYDCAIAYRVGICTDFVGYIVNSKKKITWWHHGEFGYPKRQTKRWTKVYKKFDKIIVVSSSCKEMLLNNIHGINNKTITISNMINVNEIQKKSNHDISFYFNFDQIITLVSIGRLSPEKGMINCVHACKMLVENGYSVKWFLIGEGPERRDIERCIRNYKLENNVFLLGTIPNPYPYIKNANLYVHPSLVESLSITVLEALAINTPVIVAKSMGPMEFIHHKENGLLVESTPEGLYKGVESIVKDQVLLKQLKQDKSDVLNNYSPEVIMRKIYDLIEAG
ncbi:glycosyltransferase involved in cell wall biosynthesis [Bacillus sp. SLBN-46]|uniref:glycosyltransferase n=1 Tax=Bacillus sp. SLBN-46 TaxID=3042283 RepID=UPI0028545E6C|nr:glycosyltransferase [Bacillus sp. SLBN-46]MDR6121902.1 glycosyltransferase involved in cell wall biosynthesis [Bacillus sp. SLBN-46]